ncbi:hypothetical protein GTU75_04850 [Erysipelothrix rhusiopathiae]|uniref:hypothetical protein n=1 Tax=Erysipelothrix sp. strain 2 (EsS2-7-Brazil) TaxID=2500579 RepID=UPI001378DCA5|nr:hypothetical protein [Erysipelothrix sp. strain 2 (EsS2-7-Brazil)]MBK2403729.1 hypothetical protein [Erysipelothrix sp. strain 2 (EsS2-7-Brazil)]NBA01467.1 hypothetical protein [Erysipelothrix rhusiopathiae]
MSIEDWFNFRPKEVLEHDRANYQKKIFPRGDQQKAMIQTVLLELFPKRDQMELLYHYIVCKEIITNDALDPFDQIHRIEKALKRIRPKLDFTETETLSNLLYIDANEFDIIDAQKLLKRVKHKAIV